MRKYDHTSKPRHENSGDTVTSSFFISFFGMFILDKKKASILPQKKTCKMNTYEKKII